MTIGLDRLRFSLIVNTNSEAIFKSHSPQHASSIFLIISACLLLLLSFGYRSSFGLFVTPISAHNGWGRDIISFALAIQNLSWGLVAVFAGGLADRYGNVKVLVAGTMLYAAGMALMAGVSQSPPCFGTFF